MAEQPAIPTTGEIQELPPARKRVRTHGKIHPPLIALIDIMFTLLMFFIVSCQSRQNEGELPTALPTFMGAAASDTRVMKELRIRIQHVGYDYDDAQKLTYEKVVYFLNDKSSVGLDSDQKLFEALDGARKALQSNEAPVLIEADDTVSWEAVVRAFNQAIRAQFKNVGFTGAA